MKFHLESHKEEYDVVVIGAGIGGLTAAALLARLGYAVLVIERHDRPGGYLHAFSRRGLLFDCAVHSVGGCADRGPSHRRALGMLVEHLGLGEQVRFLPLDPIAKVCFPDLELEIPQGLQVLQQRLAGLFPNQAGKLVDFFLVVEKVAEEASRIACGLPAEMEWFSRYRNATLASVWGEFLDDERLLAVVGAFWPYMGLPPRRLSFVYWALMFTGYVSHGSGYCQGSFQRLADALAGTIEASGSELMYRMGVRSILLERGRVAGVMTDNGQRIGAPTVVSNADLLHTFQHLLPSGHAPSRYLSRLERLQPSVSVFVTYASVSRAALGKCAHESFFYGHYDHERHFQDACQGISQWLSVTIPTHTDPSLAPEDTHGLMLTTLASYSSSSSWRAHKEEYKSRLLEQAQRWMPGLKRGLIFSEAGTPRTMERYTLNHQGAAYGWAAKPRQVGPGRPGAKTPVEGLYLAGHWSSPGGGVYGAALSGIQAAQAIHGIEAQDDLWHQIRTCGSKSPAGHLVRT